MLDLMCDHFFWPHMAAQAKEHIEKCCPCSHKSIRTGPPQLSMPTAREREEHFSGDRALHSICLGICNMIADCPNDS